MLKLFSNTNNTADYLQIFEIGQRFTVTFVNVFVKMEICAECNYEREFSWSS